VAFLVPFIIIYSPPLILIGSPAEIAVAAITAFIAVFALAVGFEGYLLSKVRWHHRALLIGGGILIVVPGLLSDLIGLALITATLLQYCYQASRARSLILDTKQPSP
jgi:TRAP-type uncharacterized transport system fused permease subunit